MYMQIKVNFKNSKGTKVHLTGTFRKNATLDLEGCDREEREYRLMIFDKRISFNDYICWEHFYDYYRGYKSLSENMCIEVEDQDGVKIRNIFFYCEEEYGEMYDVHIYWSKKKKAWDISHIYTYDPSDIDHYTDCLCARYKRWTVSIK